MNPEDPLPRLLRLHGMVSRAAPTHEVKLGMSDAQGLTESYGDLRAATRALVGSLQMSLEEFDVEMPALSALHGPSIIGPEAMLEDAARAATAATRLRALRGYVEGLITLTALTEELSPQQLDLVRTVISN